MPEPDSFADFICRIRAGDEQAATELVRRYERLIRFEVRLRMTDPRLGRLFDSMDVCQSVLASFFVRAAAGQYDLERPDDLIRLLVGMARNKLASHARKHRARAADRQREDVSDLDALRAPEPDPGQQVAGRELLEAVRQRLSAEEQQLVNLRAQGRSWQDVAAELGGTAEGRRKQLTRALDRIAHDLGLEEDINDAP
jgi:RNA polymerase sigma-70 factor (ECF subfamily)